MLLSVVVPAYNEEQTLPTLYKRLTEVLDACVSRGLITSYEVILVNDGSRDSTWAMIARLAETDPRIKGVCLSRNFGHEAAVTAGVDHSGGDAVVLMDADLQDPPELIAEMVARWREGIDVVYAQRTMREGEPLIKKTLSSIFYRLIARISEIDIPRDTGNFRLMDRKVVEHLRRFTEYPRFTRGIVAWIGFRQESVRYRRPPRLAGTSGYNYWSLTRLAINGITSFSTKPLTIAIWMGLSVTLLSMLATLVIIADKVLFHPEIPRGIPLLTCAVFGLGGVQLTMLGVIGMYIGQIYRNVQHRPVYIVGEKTGPASTPVATDTVELKPASQDLHH
jgi:glycosyltransferase involved in cell wall biosynthesis